MTLIVAICLEKKRTHEQSVLMFSDSQATTGPVAYSVHKIEEIWSDSDYPLAIASGAGDSAMIKKAINLSNSVLIKYATEEWDNKTPSFGQFWQAVQEIEKMLISKISEYKEMEVDVGFDLLLASVSADGLSSLYLFDSRGIAQPVHDSPRFACIGSGFVLGGNLLLQQFYSPDLDLDEASKLATYVINEVSTVDSFVGPFEGESCYFRLEKGKPVAGSITVRSLREVRSEYKWTKKLMKYVWEQSNTFGPKDLYRIIQRATKKQKKVQKSKT